MQDAETGTCVGVFFDVIGIFRLTGKKLIDFRMTKVFLFSEFGYFRVKRLVRN